MITVSIIENGAGSVAVSARPAFQRPAPLPDEIELFCPVEEPLSFCYRDTRQRSRHIKQGAFIKRRHEL